MTTLLGTHTNINRNSSQKKLKKQADPIMIVKPEGPPFLGALRYYLVSKRLVLTP
jgi:hypothetical protein